MYSAYRPQRDRPRGLQRDVVYLCWPIASSYTSPNVGGCVSANEYSCAHHVTWSPNKLWRSTSIFNLWNAPSKWCRKCPKLSAYVSVVSSRGNRGKVEVGNGSTAVQCAYVWKTYIIESTNTAYPPTDDRTIDTGEKNMSKVYQDPWGLLYSPVLRLLSCRGSVSQSQDRIFKYSAWHGVIFIR